MDKDQPTQLQIDIMTRKQQIRAARKFLRAMPKSDRLEFQIKLTMDKLKAELFDLMVEEYVVFYNSMADSLGEPHTTKEIIEPVLALDLKRTIDNL